MCKARTVRYIGLAVRVYERNETVALAVDCQQGEDERKKKRERDGGGREKEGQYFIFLSDPLSCNQQSRLHRTARHCFPRRSRRRPKLYSVCSSPSTARSLARLRFLRPLSRSLLSRKFSMKIAVYRAET